MVLTVFIRYKKWMVYVRPFEDHKEAIDHFCDLYGNLYNDAVLGITNHEEIPLGPVEIPDLRYLV